MHPDFSHASAIVLICQRSYLISGLASVITTLSRKLGCTMNISLILFFRLKNNNAVGQLKQDLTLTGLYHRHVISADS